MPEKHAHKHNEFLSRHCFFQFLDLPCMNDTPYSCFMYLDLLRTHVRVRCATEGVPYDFEQWLAELN
jgi:hypothetical protein